MTPLKASSDLPEAPVFRYRKPVRGSVIWWLRFLGIAAFVIILAINLPRSQEVQLVRIDLRWLGLAMSLTILQLLLDAFVWHFLLAAQRIRHTYFDTLVDYLASQYLGLVTPGHVGEFLAAGYISMDTGLTFGYALSSVIMKKILAWVTIAGFGIWGLPLLAGVPFLHGVKQMMWTGVIVAVVLSAGVTLWVFSLRRLAKKWQTLSPWEVDTTELWSGLKSLTSPRLVLPMAVSALSFAILFVQFDAILSSMGVALPFVQVARIIALSRIAARFVPVSLVGFGSKDAAVIVLLSQHGVDVSVALTATLLFLVCSYLVTLLLSGLCWWVKPLVIRRAVSSYP